MSQAVSSPEPVVRVLFGGDVMLGRSVGQAIRRFGPDYPLGPVSSMMRSADLTVANLECAITASTRQWQGAPKAFYFGAPPEAVHALSAAGVDLVSLANNHVLDFDVPGLRDTLAHLRRKGIRYAGAGENIREALKPAIIDCCGIRLGMAAFCDHQDDFAAGDHRPGIAWLDLGDETLALVEMRNALDALLHEDVDWSILSLHWGPNRAFRPSASFRRIAHAAIDMGWKILFGHSAHVFHGIEIYRGCPIIYSAGDLVDDYRVDPDFRNDHQLLFEMVLSRSALLDIRLHPVFIDDCQVRIANAAQARYIVGWMTSACEELGTKVLKEDGEARIELAVA